MFKGTYVVVILGAILFGSALFPPVLGQTSAGCNQGECISCPSDPKICTKCIDGWYLTKEHCELCVSTCKTCEINTHGSVSCTSCVDGTYLRKEYGSCDWCGVDNCKHCPSAGVCTACDDNYYLDSGKCKACGWMCKTCLSNTICTSCRDNTYVQDNKCHVCYGCKTCSGPDVCTSCHPGMGLDNGKCDNCPTGCRLCNSRADCTDCQYGDGYYLETGKCLKCPDKCAACSSNTFCTSCSRGFFLHEGGVCKDYDPNKSWLPSFESVKPILGAVLIFFLFVCCAVLGDRGGGRPQYREPEDPSFMVFVVPLKK